MMTNLYSLCDKVAKLFNTPVSIANSAVATRQFGDLVAKDEGIQKHPSDYALYSVGAFDNETGELVSLTPTLVCEATDFIKSNRKGK